MKIQPKRKTTKREDESSCICYLSCEEIYHGWEALIASPLSYWLGESGRRPIRLHTAGEKTSKKHNTSILLPDLQKEPSKIRFHTASDKQSNGTVQWSYCLHLKRKPTIIWFKESNVTIQRSYLLAHRERHPVGFIPLAIKQVMFQFKDLIGWPGDEAAQ